MRPGGAHLAHLSGSSLIRVGAAAALVDVTAGAAMGIVRDGRAVGCWVSVVMAASISAPLLSGDGRVREA